MEIKELEEKSSPPTNAIDSTKQVTTTVKKTKTKRSRKNCSWKKTCRI